MNSSININIQKFIVVVKLQQLSWSRLYILESKIERFGV